jgi:hypothetical protein
MHKYSLFVHKRIISAVKSVDSVSDVASCIILRGRRCDIFVQNVHVPTEKEIVNTKDSLLYPTCHCCLDIFRTASS